MVRAVRWRARFAREPGRPLPSGPAPPSNQKVFDEQIRFLRWLRCSVFEIRCLRPLQASSLEPRAEVVTCILRPSTSRKTISPALSWRRPASIFERSPTSSNVAAGRRRVFRGGRVDRGERRPEQALGLALELRHRQPAVQRSAICPRHAVGLELLRVAAHLARRAPSNSSASIGFAPARSVISLSISTTDSLVLSVCTRRPRHDAPPREAARRRRRRRNTPCPRED